MIFETDYANARQMVSWVLGLGEKPAILPTADIRQGDCYASRDHNPSGGRPDASAATGR